jgi:hypothetical protein
LRKPDHLYHWLHSFLILILLAAAITAGGVSPVVEALAQESDDNSLFLPMLQMERGSVIQPRSLPSIPRVNVPLLNSNLSSSSGAIFWFGRVNSQENYADVRIGYSSDALYLRMNIFDRYVWQDSSPSPESLSAWDSVSLYLGIDGAAFRFDAQANDLLDKPTYHVAYSGTAAGWEIASIPFNAESFWRGNGVNNDLEDRGWWMRYEIPFSSLGLQGAPPEGSVWKMGIKLYDRDDAAGSSRPTQSWPASPLSENSEAWGDLAFGLPAYSPAPNTGPAGTLTVRHKLDGAVVRDAMVGGGTVCGSGLDFWNEWGDTNYAVRHQVNVQNQIDVADWPCFSKFYLTFPLASLPPGKVILSAELTLHHFGNSGGGDYGDPPPSLIHVFTVDGEWDENTLTWNNAPLALENISREWVEPILELTDWRGIPRTWDVSLAVNQAYQSGQPLHLALYSADSPMHTGKYFFSSKVDDYSAVSRPTLTIVWGNP